ncbi:ankyrin repeat-containing protein, partial [Acanthamoeba castellanii str. Neff]
RLIHGRPLTQREERERRARKAQSAFREAVRQGDARSVATLLARQVVEPATIDAPYTLGGHETSPMLDACGAGHVDVVRLLIEHGGDVNRRVGHATPLYVAAKAGHGRVVELLLEHGAETEPRLGTRRNSAVAELPGGSLHHHDVVDMLLGRGASFLSPDYAGETPMDLLRRWAQDV